MRSSDDIFQFRFRVAASDGKLVTFSGRMQCTVECSRISECGNKVWIVGVLVRVKVVWHSMIMYLCCVYVSVSLLCKVPV